MKVRQNETSVVIETYSEGCADNPVFPYRIEGGGHTWPGGAQYLSERVIGRLCEEFRAEEVVWAFFSSRLE